MRKQLLKDHNFLNSSPIFIIESSTFDLFAFKKHCIQYISIWKIVLVWWKVLNTIILWQDVGPCCEQTHAAFEVGLSLDQGQGVYRGWSDVDGSSQLRLCHTCIIDVMIRWCSHGETPTDYPLMRNMLRFVSSNPTMFYALVRYVCIYRYLYLSIYMYIYNVCTPVANCLCAHKRVILVLISRVAQKPGQIYQNSTRVSA